MSPLVAKEIRLLLPAFGMALLLVIFPVWMPPYDSREVSLIVGLFGIGAVMLALSSFGREFSLKTFPMIMAQPIERRRLWWTKLMVLAVAMAALFSVWSTIYHYVPFPSVHVYVDPNYADAATRREMFLVGGMTVLVALAGALWTTLLLRQVTAAFWVTILIPGAILMIIEMCRGNGKMMFAAMCAYTAAGFWLAWWQFSRAQETAWTGGVITLSGWKKADEETQRSSRTRRPWGALFWKELQLHQVMLMGMAGLFALQLGVVCLRKFGNIPTENPIHAALDVFGGIWFIVPLVSAGLCVAEERRLGTIQDLLCLPVSSRKQFFIKFLVTMIISGLLSAVLLWTAESLSLSIGAGGIFSSEKGPAFIFDRFIVLLAPFLALSLIGLYASTLARGIVQAIAAAIATIAAIAAIFNLLSSSWNLFGIPLWRGALVYYITWPALIVVCIWLAFRNFKSLSENWRFWRGNLLAFASALVFTSITTTAIYNRVWELFSNPEPAHGPPRLAGPYRPALHSLYGANVLTALLPDGRLWVGGIAFFPGEASTGIKHTNGLVRRMIVAAVGGGSWRGFTGNYFMPGSNWVDAVAGWHETVAIRSDGTLWLAENLLDRSNGNGSPREEGANPVKVFNGTQWKNFVPGSWMTPMLLKKNGTLWMWWRHVPNGARGVWPAPDLGPEQVGNKSNWDRTLPCPGHQGFYAWQKDGRAWIVHPPITSLWGQGHTADTNTEDLESGQLVMTRFPRLDNTSWRSVAGWNDRQIGVREDGTLWHWNLGDLADRFPTAMRRPRIHDLNQLGADTNWVDAAGDAGTFGLLKADGSLWIWNLSSWQSDEEGHFFPINPPVRLSRHKDWLAVSYAEQGIVALAADGGLWHWWNQSLSDDSDPFLPQLRPSRRPSFVENILDDQK